MVKRYKFDIGAGQEKTGARSLRIKLFKINERKIEETQKRQLDRGALGGDGCNAILKREAYSTSCRKELRPDLFNEDDPCTVAASDRFNMEYKHKLQDEAVIAVERKVTKFFQTPVEIDEARTISRELLNHRGSRIEEYSWSGMDLGDGRLIRSQDQWTRFLGPLRVEHIWNVLVVQWRYGNE